MMWGRKPLVLNTLQIRLAIELAAQKAFQVELQHQLQAQLPHTDVRVMEGWIDIRIDDWPPIVVPGREVVWE